MQNPFGNRPQNEFGRDDRDDRWEARDRRRDESASWSEGDGGRTAEAFRQQGARGDSRRPEAQYGQGMSTAYAGGPQPGSQAYGGPQYGQGYGALGYDSQGYAGQGAMGQGGMGGQSFDQRGYGASSGQTTGYGSPTSQGYAEPGYGAQGYRGQAGMDQPHASHGYAPGSQIWEGAGRGMGGQSHEHHDFEPDYLHWRQQQLSALDKDYSDWRNERREKFSSDFDSWRQSRPRVQAENPIVGDVSDGGTGNSAELKKR